MANASPAPLLGGRDIVTFANDWTADPTSKHHIMRRFSRTNDVLWIEAAGMRAPKLASAYDRKRLLTKAKAILRKSRPALDRLHVMSPPALPYPAFMLAQQANGCSTDSRSRGSSIASGWIASRCCVRLRRNARRTSDAFRASSRSITAWTNGRRSRASTPRRWSAASASSASRRIS